MHDIQNPTLHNIGTKFFIKYNQKFFNHDVMVSLKWRFYEIQFFVDASTLRRYTTT